MSKNNPKWAEQERKRREDPEYKRVRDEGKKDRHLRRKFGITWEDYQRMVKEQDGKCAICLKEPSGRYRLVVDHCHETNKVRKLLCHTCNTKLGWLENNLESCLKYLNIKGVKG